MHILIIGSFAPSLLNFRGPLIQDLIAAGHKVSVTAPDIDPTIRAGLIRIGAEVYETPLQRTGTGIRADLRYGIGLRRLMRALRPDRVLTYTIKPNIWGAFAAASCGIASVAMVTGLGIAFTDDGRQMTWKRRLTRVIAKTLYRGSTALNRRVIFQNPDDRDDFIAAGCLGNPAKVSLVNGSGVDLGHYARATLPDQPVFLMIARLLRTKGVSDYAEAALSLRKTHHDARFLLVGPFDESPDSIRQADLDRWIAGGLEYLGPVEDVRPAIMQARVYVLPSYREGTPRSVLEAMAMGRAIITTDAPGCRETIVHESEGLLVPVRDPIALANAMKRMLQDADMTTHMADRAFHRVVQKYDVHAVNRSVMQILDR